MLYSAAEVAEFQRTVWDYYDKHGRHELPWRWPDEGGEFDPYKILVSEVMLQQTQVTRVIPKYLQFLEQFPTVQALANASLGEVLIAWQGLGYNRRAKFLWRAAQLVCQEYAGVFPQTQAALTRLPGIGANTAGAVVAYAYNQPAVFIETNIRTVFIHHFLHDATAVPDKEVAVLVEAALPAGQRAPVRMWYWALMDYGAHLKQTVGNKARASRSYVKQPPFVGSRRAVRGAVIRALSAQDAGLTTDELAKFITDPRLPDVLQDLQAEGMVRERTQRYRLA